MLRGQRALVIGVSNARSIAWGVADRWRREGAEVFITYQNERFRGSVEKLLHEKWEPFVEPFLGTKHGIGRIPAAPCDVSSEVEIEGLFRTLEHRGFCSSSSSQLQPTREGDGNEVEDRHRGEMDGEPKIDVILHSVAHAPTEAMQGVSFLQLASAGLTAFCAGLCGGTREAECGYCTKGTTKDAFISAHVVSAYSLVSTVRHALPFLAPGASVVALTYIGSQRAANNYNVMGPAKASLESCARALAKELGSPENGGVRVNCLSPGPVRTMAARGITAFDQMRREAAQRAPLGRDAGIDEIAGAATFLASPLAACVTGQTIYADCGFSSVI